MTMPLVWSMNAWSYCGSVFVTIPSPNSWSTRTAFLNLKTIWVRQSRKPDVDVPIFSLKADETKAEVPRLFHFTKLYFAGIYTFLIHG